MPTDPITAARLGLDRAQQAITDAENARDESRAQLDQALLARGWRRLPSIGDGPGVYEDRRTGHVQDFATVIDLETSAAA